MPPPAPPLPVPVPVPPVAVPVPAPPVPPVPPSFGCSTESDELQAATPRANDTLIKHAARFLMPSQWRDRKDQLTARDEFRTPRRSPATGRAAPPPCRRSPHLLR